MCKFPAYCFFQRTYMAHGLVNGVHNEIELILVHSLNVFQLLIAFI